MAGVPGKHDIEQLQQENARLRKQLVEVKQRKQERAINKAQAKLARLQEQIQIVNALNAAKETRAALQEQQLDELHKLETHLRLSELQLYTGEALSVPWGTVVTVCLKAQEPGMRTQMPPEEEITQGLRLSKQPFAIGGMRLAYHAQTAKGERFVAKRLLSESAHPQKNIDAFVEDLQTHREAARLAKVFNIHCRIAGVSGRVFFGAVSIVEVPCMDMDPSVDKANAGNVNATAALNAPKNLQEKASCAGSPTVLLLEDYMWGKFTKWNTNTGQVHNMTDIIPQAFSHFTYHETLREASGHPRLVVDLQGYVHRTGTFFELTDPAIHCEKEPHSYGATNCGARGIRQFFKSHQCNDVCRALGLPEQILHRPLGASAPASGHVAAVKLDSIIAEHFNLICVAGVTLLFFLILSASLYSMGI